MPPHREAVREAIPVIFDLLDAETEPSVRAAFGHSLFGYIHPYPDGNKRMARFIMNAMLDAGIRRLSMDRHSGRRSGCLPGKS